MRILIYALEGDQKAQKQLEALHADTRQAGRRNAELWEGNVEAAKKVYVFPNPNAEAIAAAYGASKVEVEVVSSEKDKGKNSGNAKNIKADEGQSNQAEKGSEGGITAAAKPKA